MWFFTADWHLNHANIIKYCNRPFLSKEESDLLVLAKNGSIPLKSIKIGQDSVQKMNSAIIEATNNVVDANDNLVILGDFCWSSTPRNILKEIRDSINCKNLYLIWGNHDNRQTFKPFFKSTQDQYLFHIEGQQVFTSHYPCRTWPHSSYGSWMLYGHVHNKFWHQDNECFTEEEISSLKDRTINLLNNAQASYDSKTIDNFLLFLKSFFRKTSLTLDVGIDNVRENIPFGTPWSFSDIKSYMERKIINRENA